MESRLIEIAGEVGRKLHTGRSRNEQIATDMRLYVRERIEYMTLLLGDVIGALIAQAEQAGDAAMPSYTHLQRAEPVLIAHWLLAYSEMFFRDISTAGRLPQAAESLSAGVGGGGRERSCRWIASMWRRCWEFDGPTANSMDATSDRDFAIEVVQALSE